MECAIVAEPVDQMLTADEVSSVIKIDVEGGELPILRRLIETMNSFRKLRCLLVELAPSPIESECSVVFERLFAHGFEAFEVVNIYDVAWYLKRKKPQPLVSIKTVPGKKVDVLFIRSR